MKRMGPFFNNRRVYNHPYIEDHHTRVSKLHNASFDTFGAKNNRLSTRSVFKFLEKLFLSFILTAYSDVCALIFLVILFKDIMGMFITTVESRISGTQNSGKSSISGQFLNDQLFIK